MNKNNVLLLYFDDASEESKFNSRTAHDIYNALLIRDYKVKLFQVTELNWRKSLIMPGDIIFNYVEDQSYSLYAKVACGLEKLGRSQFATNIKMLVINKDRVKRKLLNHNLPTPKYITVNSDYFNLLGLDYPLIVKPSGCHSSVGIDESSIVTNDEELIKKIEYVRNYIDNKVVVEEFILGREISVTVIGNGDSAFTLPYSEIILNNKWKIFGYDTKWINLDYFVKCPAEIPNRLQKKIDEIVLKAYKVLGCLDIARIDLRVDENDNVYIFDPNPSPSISTINFVTGDVLNWQYEDFIEVLVGICHKRVYGIMPKSASLILDRIH